MKKKEKDDEIRKTMNNLAFSFSPSHHIQKTSHAGVVRGGIVDAARLIGVNYKPMICVI